MIRTGVVLLLAGVSALSAACPGAGAAPPDAARGAAPGYVDAQEQEAMRLLRTAARASSDLSWQGTKFVAGWRDGHESSSVLEMQHTAGGELRVIDGGRSGAVVAPDPDLQLLEVLSAGYALARVGQTRSTGRVADVVEVRRTGDRSLAARFWVDRGSGVVLRRELYDARERRVRSSGFLDLSVAPPAAAAPVSFRVQQLGSSEPAPTPDPDPPAGAEAARVAPERLPGGFQRFDARWRTHQGARVLHLAYTDGLSALSVFVQPGVLSEPPAQSQPRDVGGTTVHVHVGVPERLVWQSGRSVWTVVTEAPPDVVRDVVLALPREPAVDDGVGARLERGLQRMGSWVGAD